MGGLSEAAVSTAKNTNAPMAFRRTKWSSYDLRYITEFARYAKRYLKFLRSRQPYGQFRHTRAAERWLAAQWTRVGPAIEPCGGKSVASNL